jgi:hypothetical protein
MSGSIFGEGWRFQGERSAAGESIISKDSENRIEPVLKGPDSAIAADSRRAEASATLRHTHILQ